MQTHFKLYTAVLAERSELLVQCIFINDSLLSLHSLKPLEFVQLFTFVFKTMPRCPHGDNKLLWAKQ